MHPNRPDLRKENKRKAALTVELLVILPILLFLLLAIVLFSLLETSEQRVIQASAQGCRVAAQGGSLQDVQIAVGQSLGSQRLRSHARVEAEFGARTGDPVLVRVSIPAKKVIPDLLSFLGYTIEKETLVGQTVLRRE